MPRGPRHEAESGIHHVMNRGVDHQQVFFADVDRIEFGRRLAAVHDELGVVVLAYCLMDNHFHLLLKVPDSTLSEAMRRLTSLYTRHTNDRIGRDGPLFRGRFHSIPVETDAYLLQAARYIHLNPSTSPASTHRAPTGGRRRRAPPGPGEDGDDPPRPPDPRRPPREPPEGEPRPPDGRRGRHGAAPGGTTAGGGPGGEEDRRLGRGAPRPTGRA